MVKWLFAPTLLVSACFLTTLMSPVLQAEDWNKQSCNQAQKRNRFAFEARYMEEAGFGGVMKSLSGGTTTDVRFNLISPQVLKRQVCEIKKVERLSEDEAEGLYQARIGVLKAGYIPLTIQVKNKDNRVSLGYEYGADAGEARGIFLQSKKNRDLFLREAKDLREEIFQGYSEWSNTWQGTALVVFFPFEEDFFAKVGEIEAEIRYGGSKGQKPRRASFPKKAAELLVEQMQRMLAGGSKK